jgi:DNA polymerase III alpha subunit (gram-positive type)
VSRGFFWDFETTSLDTKKARVIEGAFAIYDLETRQRLFQHTALVWDKNYPDIEPVTTSLTGISQPQLEEFGVSPGVFFDTLLTYGAKCDYWVAHNGFNYDCKVLKEEMKRHGLGEPPNVRHVDTRFDLPYPDHISTRKLTHLGAELQIFNTDPHSALADVSCMARLFFLYPVESILARADSPFLWIRADVTFEKKDYAKALNYFWDAVNKIWIKVIRENELENEKEKAAAKFRVLPLPGYEPPAPLA